jgi:hypothetical protein
MRAGAAAFLAKPVELNALKIADTGKAGKTSWIYRGIFGSPAHWLGNRRKAVFALFVAGVIPCAVLGAQDSAVEDSVIAQGLAEMLQNARTVISNEQDLINDPQLGDKHLTGKVVLDRTVEHFLQATGIDPIKTEPGSREGRLLRAMMQAIVQVVDDNQATINAKGTGFKGFIPAVFGRLVAEEFGQLAKGEAEVKVTAPPELVRNRKARPDKWEAEVIKTKLLDPAWPSAALLRDSRYQWAVGIPGYGPGVLRTVLPGLSRHTQGRNGHHRLPQGRRKAERPGLGGQHHPLSLNRMVMAETQ